MNRRINKLIAATLLPFKLRDISVFGSCSRDEMQPDSYIYTLIDLNESVSLLHLGSLYMDLSEKLQTKIGLVTKNGVNQVFKNNIEKDLIPIYRAS